MSETFILNVIELTYIGKKPKLSRNKSQGFIFNNFNSEFNTVTFYIVTEFLFNIFILYVIIIFPIFYNVML